MNPIAAIALSCGLAAFITPADAAAAPTELEKPMFVKATPILFVKDVEGSLVFFTDRLGFEKTIEVPSEDGIVFAAVEADGVEIMFQASGAPSPDFTPEEMAAREGRGFLYIEVSDFTRITDAARSAEIVKDAHKTDYGAEEIYIREPGGNVIGFAKPGG